MDKCSSSCTTNKNWRGIQDSAYSIVTQKKRTILDEGKDRNAMMQTSIDSDIQSEHLWRLKD